MKKIGIILLMAALFSCNDTQAQITMYKSTALQSGITTSTTDTLDNSEISYFNAPSGSLNKYTACNYTVHFTLDTISGTVTPGNVILQGSYDGITWFNLGGNPGTDGKNCDSLTYAVGNCANAVNYVSSMGGTNKYAYTILNSVNSPRVTYIRLKLVSTGTQSTRIYNVKLIPFTR